MVQQSKIGKRSPKEKLTAAEMGKLWVTYMGNSMSQYVLEYYLIHVEDPDIKKVIQYAYDLSKFILKNIEEIFIEENFPIPNGFTEKDVNLGAPKLFEDEFYLHYLKYTGKAGLSIYSIAIPLMIRKDIRDFYIQILNSTLKLMCQVNEVLQAKGFLIEPPPIPIPEKIDYIDKQNYLNGVFGRVRTLHALEITHLHDNIENNVASKALLIGFYQTAKDEEIKKYFIRGKELTNKHIELSSEKLRKDNLPAPHILDHLVTTSNIAPFSDKIMLYHKIDMFSMKIRTYGNGASLNGRRDLGWMYARFLLDIARYVEDGANIMIEKGWMEQLPQAVDRDHLPS